MNNSPKTIRVAFGSVPKDGGTFTFYRNMRPALFAHNIDLKCVTVGARECELLEPTYVDDGCIVLAQESESIREQARAFVEWCIAEKIDIVMAINSVAILSALPQLPKHIRVMARCANAFDEGYRVTMSGRERLMRIVALTPRLRDDLISDYGADPEVIELIPNGIDPKPFERINHTIETAEEQLDEAHENGNHRTHGMLGNDFNHRGHRDTEHLDGTPGNKIATKNTKEHENDLTTRCARGGEGVRDLNSKEMNDALSSQSNLASQESDLTHEKACKPACSVSPESSESSIPYSNSVSSVSSVVKNETAVDSKNSVSSVSSSECNERVVNKEQETGDRTSEAGDEDPKAVPQPPHSKALRVTQSTADSNLTSDVRSPISKTKLQLGFLGRLEHNQKGVLYLPEIVRELKKRGVDFHLRIAGKGKHRPELEAGLQPFIESGEVELIGALTKDEVPGFLTSIDVYLFTSHFEGCPNALLEAMMAGCAPVAFMIDGITDFVLDHGRTGFIAPMGDCAAFAAQVCKCASDQEFVSQIQRAARAEALERFVPEVAAREYARVFSEVMAAPLPDFEPLPWSRFQVDEVYRPTGLRRLVPSPIKNLVKKILS